MSREKQIEKIKDCIDSVYGCDCAYYGVEGMAIAQALVNAGYRKQSEGEWVEHIEKPKWLEDDVDVFYECSVCKTQSPAPTKFCPNCGARMKGGAE